MRVHLKVLKTLFLSFKPQILLKYVCSVGLKENLSVFIDAFEALRNVKRAAFRKTLHPNYLEVIKAFEDKRMALHQNYGISFTHKCHIIMQHIPEVIRRTRARLYLGSEQVVEAAHQKFGVFWDRYKVLDLDNISMEKGCCHV